MPIYERPATAEETAQALAEVEQRRVWEEDRILTARQYALKYGATREAAQRYQDKIDEQEAIMDALRTEAEVAGLMPQHGMQAILAGHRQREKAKRIAAGDEPDPTTEAEFMAMPHSGKLMILWRLQGRIDRLVEALGNEMDYLSERISDHVRDQQVHISPWMVRAGQVPDDGMRWKYPDDMKIDATPWQELCGPGVYSRMVSMAFYEKHIQTLGDLRRMTKNEFLRNINVGRITWTKVKKLLDEQVEDGS
jgi:hypothetical protein